MTGGLPDPPETVVLGSDQMTVRIAWIEPPGERLNTPCRVVITDRVIDQKSEAST